jgi:hypothetical protein
LDIGAELMSDPLAEARAVPAYDGYTYDLINRLAAELEFQFELREGHYRNCKEWANILKVRCEERDRALAAAKVMREALKWIATDAHEGGPQFCMTVATQALAECEREEMGT